MALYAAPVVLRSWARRLDRMARTAEALAPRERATIKLYLETQAQECRDLARAMLTIEQEQREKGNQS